MTLRNHNRVYIRMSTQKLAIFRDTHSFKPGKSHNEEEEVHMKFHP